MTIAEELLNEAAHGNVEELKGQQSLHPKDAQPLYTLISKIYIV